MNLKKIIGTHNGFSIIELMIVIALMSVVAMPAYLALENGYKIFRDESTYQSVLSDVQILYDRMNTRIRLEGFRNIDVLKTATEVEGVDGLKNVVNMDFINVLKVGDVYYHLRNNSIYVYTNNHESKLADNIAGFSIDFIEDGQFVTINTRINVDGREETISTTIYERY